MPFTLDRFADAGLTPALLDALVQRHERSVAPSLRVLWTYFRNPISQPDPARSASRSPRRAYRLGQERGLPARILGPSADPALDDRAAQRREVVIENDIAWRIQTMVDFMFGRPVSLVSTARDPALRADIDLALADAWHRSGGIALLQDAALLGHVYGHVDLLVRSRAGDVSIEIVEPTRGIPLLSPADYRALDAYIVRHLRESPAVIDPAPTTARWVERLFRGGNPSPVGVPERARVVITEVLSPAGRQLYEQHDPDNALDARLLEDEPNSVSPGRIPVVHIQNISQPFAYHGLGEVEPLIPLQDELNTRLSDRASRITMQSFKMFLAKGVDGFDKVPIGPGQVWATDNMDASVEPFGGDADAPGETEHIEQVREAMDKVSGVPPLAGGVVRAKIGNLTSENALRVTLMSLLSKTERKRVTYGRGIADASRLLLDALDHAGILKTDPADRGVRVAWHNPVPTSESDTLAAARAKLDLGIPRERVLDELGYPAPPSATP